MQAPHGNRLATESALVLAAGLLSLYRSSERDIWFHLAAGRSILEHGLPSREVWCLAAYGEWPWLGEWLFHVAVFTVRDLAGDLGVGLWRAGWTAAAMSFALALARLAGAGIGTVALLSPLVLDILRARMLPRPEQLTLALALLFLLVLERTRRGGRAGTPWLLPVQVAWANLHPAWILGPLLTAGYAAIEALGGGPGRGRRAARFALLALGLFACGAVTPRPLDTLTFRTVRDAFADPTVGSIGELRPWSWREDAGNPYTGLLALSVAGAALGGARVFRQSPALVALAAVGLLGGITFYRMRGLAALLAAPVLAAALTEVRRRSRRFGPRTALAVVAAAAGSLWLAVDARRYPPGVAPVPTSFPMRAAALAESLRLEGPVLNTSWYGGYLLWARGEDHLPLQDTRNLGDAALRSRLRRSRFDPAALDTLLREWSFSHAIFEPPRYATDRLAGMLFERPDWALVFADDSGLLYVQRDRYPAAAERLAYGIASPDYARLAEVAQRAQEDTALERRLVAELRRARRESPWNTRATLWLGLLALARGESSEALALLDEVARAAPLTPGLALRQGIARQRLGDVAGARRAYRRALRDTTDADAARRALEQLPR
jgi:hypothetical protein